MRARSSDVLKLYDPHSREEEEGDHGMLAVGQYREE